MAKLKLGIITDDKPVKLTVEIPASTHRDLLAYAEALTRDTGQTITNPAQLVGPILSRYMATDRGFQRAKKEKRQINSLP